MDLFRGEYISEIIDVTDVTNITRVDMEICLIGKSDCVLIKWPIPFQIQVLTNIK